ncbi:MAG: histidine--tRNA ligase [bacterium]
MSKQFKTPKRLKGFNDFFAKDMMIREFVINTFKAGFEKYGYEPLETPALEYSELMLGQSGSEAEKMYYRFKDNGGRDVMLKFEVMIAMCRALAQNIGNIPLPYKRYQIQRVWRAENVQKGRYREFTQCDADTIGSSSMTADAEYIQMGIEIVAKLGFKEFMARVSNRKFLEGLAVYLGVPKEQYYKFFMSIDKIEKIGKEGVVKEMTEIREISEDIARKAVKLIDPVNYKDMSFQEILNSFENTVATTDIGKEGLDELGQINDYLIKAGVDSKYFKFDTSIARGLASYTGPVWEFSIIEGGVGSIAGCGRYDNAIGKYLGDQEVPATGGSFGIERICDIIKDRGMLDFPETTIKVLVVNFSAETMEYQLKIAQALRDKGINTMLYPEIEKIGKQMKYADKKGIEFVIIAGSDELQEQTVTIKNLLNGEEKRVDFSKLVDAINSKLVTHNY